MNEKKNEQIPLFCPQVAETAGLHDNESWDVKRLLFLFRGCRYKYRRSAFLCIQKVAEVECLARPGARPGPGRRASCYEPQTKLKVRAGGRRKAGPVEAERAAEAGAARRRVAAVERAAEVAKSSVRACRCSGVGGGVGGVVVRADGRSGRQRRRGRRAGVRLEQSGQRSRQSRRAGGRSERSGRRRRRRRRAGELLSWRGRQRRRNWSGRQRRRGRRAGVRA